MKRVFTAALLMIGCMVRAQERVAYTVDYTHVKAPIPASLWGIFFEDINRGADGGLNADLVKNGSFEFSTPMMGWKVAGRNPDGTLVIVNRGAMDANNPKYLQVHLEDGASAVGLSNEGFGGMMLKKDLSYEFSMVCRQATAGIQLRLELINNTGKVIGTGSLQPSTKGTEWGEQSTTITPSDTASKARLLIWFEGSGNMDIDFISLYPPDTWKKRSRGLRTDMVQAIADIKPGFIRFPGGCIVEGTDLNERYQWKQTIGPRIDRRLIVNKWNHGIAARPAPDYYQSYALGFYEYFQLCEDLKADPMPIINCGMSCQFNTSEVVPMDQLGPYIQDALDLIEFANGDASTTWGQKRASLGHPAAFNVKWLGIGNENWGPQYIERLQSFTRAIKERYPTIQLITSTGYSPNPQFKYMDSALRKLHVDIIDEHYYHLPTWFLMNSAKYDHYDRKGPKIFLGEYAAQSVRIGSQENKNTLLCALAEAAFMTGLERNADIVLMSAYAPLFAHTNDWQWTPNLIWFNNAQVVNTPSYYVQQLFSTNRGTHVVPLLEDGVAVTGQDSCYGTAAIDTTSNEIIVKLVNASGVEKQRDLQMDGVKKKSFAGTLTVLKGPTLQVMNSPEYPNYVIPVSQKWEAKNNAEVTLPPYSLSIIRFKFK